MSELPTTEPQFHAWLVEPQPHWIESSGRWCWPLPEKAHFPGCCTEVVTASREWWVYAPEEAKPIPGCFAAQDSEARWFWIGVPRPAAAGLATGGTEQPAPVPSLPQPTPMLLWCPECGNRHVDVGEFATKVHHTHACQSCGMVWRPAIGPTVGVQWLPGFKNER
jgi:hypothetical protein